MWIGELSGLELMIVHLVWTQVEDMDGLRLKTTCAHGSHWKERHLLGLGCFLRRSVVLLESPFSCCASSTLLCMCMTVVLVANTSPGITTYQPKVILLPHKQNSVFSWLLPILSLFRSLSVQLSLVSVILPSALNSYFMFNDMTSSAVTFKLFFVLVEVYIPFKQSSMISHPKIWLQLSFVIRGNWRKEIWDTF